LPNTFYAKNDGLHLSGLLTRLREIAPFAVSLTAFGLLAVAGLRQVWRLPGHDALSIFSALAITCALPFASSTEWMPGYRYEVPAVPLLVVFAALGVREITGRFRLPKRPVGYRAAAAGMFALLMFSVSTATPALANRRLDWESLERAHIALGLWLSGLSPSATGYASWDMGAVPFYSRIGRIIDIYPRGILNAYTTHHTYDVEDILAQEPSIVVLPPPANSPLSGTYFSDAGFTRDFYASPTFGRDYRCLFAVSGQRDYVLMVYASHDLVLSAGQLSKGLDLAQVSLRESGYPIAASHSCEDFSKRAD
jgi:hypothetical protein